MWSFRPCTTLVACTGSRRGAHRQAGSSIRTRWACRPLRRYPDARSFRTPTLRRSRLRRDRSWLLRRRTFARRIPRRRRLEYRRRHTSWERGTPRTRSDRHTRRRPAHTWRLPGRTCAERSPPCRHRSPGPNCRTGSLRHPHISQAECTSHIQADRHTHRRSVRIRRLPAHRFAERIHRCRRTYWVYRPLHMSSEERTSHTRPPLHSRRR